jgi:hypothetical protein
MKILIKLFFFALFLVVLVPAGFAQNKTQDEICYNPNAVMDTSKKSIKSMAVGTIGGDSVKIKYHSPGVRKRVIWGGLVPFDEVWVTGAHDATTIEVDKVFIVGGKELPAGKYALFTIPGKKEWTVIINKNWQQHLASEYDKKDDLVRVKVKPKKTAHTERLQYFVKEGSGASGSIAVAWEKVWVEVPLTIKH